MGRQEFEERKGTKEIQLNMYKPCKEERRAYNPNQWPKRGNDARLQV